MTKDADVLGPEIRRFISSNVDSVATLEILLFFMKEREKEWTAKQVSTELRSSLPVIDMRINHLVGKGFLSKGTSNVSFKYEPGSGDIARLLEQLSRLYCQYKLRIIEQIYSPRQAIQEFADAFKLKREDEDG
jgi:hypothetical protein